MTTIFFTAHKYSVDYLTVVPGGLNDTFSLKFFLLLSRQTLPHWRVLYMRVKIVWAAH